VLGTATIIKKEELPGFASSSSNKKPPLELHMRGSQTHPTLASTLSSSFRGGGGEGTQAGDKFECNFCFLGSKKGGGGGDEGF
jgi:hypothetical protein